MDVREIISYQPATPQRNAALADSLSKNAKAHPKQAISLPSKLKSGPTSQSAFDRGGTLRAAEKDKAPTKPSRFSDESEELTAFLNKAKTGSRESVNDAKRPKLDAVQTSASASSSGRSAIQAQTSREQAVTARDDLQRQADARSGGDRQQAGASGARNREEQAASAFKARKGPLDNSSKPNTASGNAWDSVGEAAELETLSEATLRRMLIQFEKRVLKNREMRTKYPDEPTRFLDSELELHDALQELHVVATQPDLYGTLVETGTCERVVGLLAHENTDVACETLDLLQELTDVEVDMQNATEAERERAADALDRFVDALWQVQIVSALVQNLDRLDEQVKEESQAVYNTMAIVENLTELQPERCSDIAKQGMLAWLLRRLRARLPFDANRLYASELVSILVQSSDENRELLGTLDGVDTLLQLVAPYKRHDPATQDEVECMENLFNTLCAVLMTAANRERFLKGEGLQLMNLLLREKQLSRNSAMKVLSFAMTGFANALCDTFVEILGLKTIFPLFVHPPKANRRVGITERELVEHTVTIVASLLRNCSDSTRPRLIAKFIENDYEKVDRLAELHFTYSQYVRTAERQFAREADEEDDDERYLRRLDAGLFTLQLVDYAIVELASYAQQPSIGERIRKLFSMRSEPLNNIQRSVLEYADHLGDESTEPADQARIAQEKQRLVQLARNFAASASSAAT